MPAPPRLQAAHARRPWSWLALASAVVALVLALDAWQEYRDTGQRERRQLTQQAATLHDNLALQLDAAGHALSSLLAELPSLQRESDGKAQLSVRLRAYADAMPAVQYLSLLDAQGTITVSSDPALVGRNSGQRDYFAAARSASPLTLVVSPPFRGALGGWVMVLARPVFAPDGRFAGALVAALDADYLRLLMRPLHGGPDVLVSLSHGDGLRFLALGRSGERDGVKLDVAGSAWSRHLASGAPDSLLTAPMRPEAPQEQQIVALRTLQPPELHMDKPLVIAVGRDVPAVYADWRSDVASALLLWLVGNLLAAAALLWVQRKQRQRQREQDEQAAREAQNQAHWDVVLAATHQGLWDFDKAAGTTSYSPQWYALLGYTQEAFEREGKTWEDLVHPDDRPKLATAWQQVLQGQKDELEASHRLRCADGSYRWFACQGRVMERDAGGAPLRVFGTLADISERRQQEEMLQRLTENLPGLLYQYQLEPDGHSHFPYTSPQVADIYGFSAQELQQDAAPVFERIRSGNVPRGVEDLRRSARELSEWSAEYLYEIPGRGARWLSGHARPQRLPSGATLWHGYISDVTEAKEQSLRLQATERVLQQLMSEMPVGLCMVDARHRVYFRNQRFLDQLGYDEHEVPTLREWALKAYPDPDYRAEAAARWKQAKAEAVNGQIAAQSYRIVSSDGAHHMMDVAGLIFGDKLLLTFQDHTAHLVQNEWLRKLAYVDGLTGIANRRSFDEALAAEWSRCARAGLPLSVLMIDIDHFKAYNDLYGHQKGDACLQTVARTLSQSMARPHDLLARYGGEEFVCLLPQCDLEGARVVAERLCGAVFGQALVHEGSSAAPCVTISVGVACTIPELQREPATLTELADVHLYRAKLTGRNRLSDGLNDSWNES
ncbi:diguanylate cyclase domain-containing protein [Comamonas sp. NLF-1-9]|uniref:diguanylate cyclase domain-containing protein n=1 Tax=Comamonas sp. NLF-1-9 TaxID=2853163 RepID=UPI001C44F4F6|nr:diguanylate cyclase [Comamonas sp. NLF-1-9]QXL83288.1 diguanylate cyclase [Comamonas sp. NLF-1-9]